MAAQNPNLLSPLSPPSTPSAEGGDGPPPLPDRKPANHSAFRFPGIKHHSPFSSPRGSPRTSPSPSPRTSPFASPKTSPVGSPINIQRKVPPPLPPSDYDADEPPIIPPKPSMAQVRSTYQSRRVNSNPQGFVAENANASGSSSKKKPLSKSHDPLPTIDKEEECELSHSLPDQETSMFEECTQSNFEVSAYKPSIPDHRGDRSLIDKPQQAQRIGNVDGNRSVINEESKRSPLPHPSIPSHRSAPDGAVEPSNNFPLYSMVGQGLDVVGSKDKKGNHPSPVRARPKPKKNSSDPIIKGTALKKALNMSETSQSPIAPARSKRNKPQAETVPDLLSHIDHETLGARPRQCPEEFRPELPNPFAPVPDLFMNSLYEPLYLAEEPHPAAIKGVELRESRVHLKDDRRHSCPVKAEPPELERSNSWNKTATLNRSKSKINEVLHDTGTLDPKRPVPVPPGKSFKELERRYSSETTGADVTPNRNTVQDSSHHSEIVDNDHAAVEEIYDQPVPILPVKKRQSIKNKQPDIVIEENSNKSFKERVGPVKRDVYYTLPQDITPVKEAPDNTDFYEVDESDASGFFYEFPTKVISEPEPEETVESSTGGNVGFEDDFSSMFPRIKRTASDPFRNDDFFSVPSSNAEESQTIGSSEESPDPSPPSRPPRSTKQVNGESLTIGKDEKIDSFVDQRTGRTMVAGPGRFFRPGQASGRQRPIEFYEEDFNILMSQGYSREQITRALVIAENNFALARKILKEFAAPNK